MAPHPTLSTTIEEHAAFYFNTYSRDLLVQVTAFSVRHTACFLRRIPSCFLSERRVGGGLALLNFRNGKAWLSQSDKNCLQASPKL